MLRSPKDAKEQYYFSRVMGDDSSTLRYSCISAHTVESFVTRSKSAPLPSSHETSTTSLSLFNLPTCPTHLIRCFSHLESRQSLSDQLVRYMASWSGCPNAPLVSLFLHTLFHGAFPSIVNIYLLRALSGPIFFDSNEIG